MDMLAAMRIFLNHLLLRNGKQVSVGFLVGVSLAGFARLFSPIINKWEYVDLEAVKDYHFVTFGIIIMFLPIFAPKEKPMPIEIEHAFKLIETARQNGASELEIKTMYRELTYKVIGNVSTNNQTNDSIPS